MRGQHRGVTEAQRRRQPCARSKASAGNYVIRSAPWRTGCDGVHYRPCANPTDLIAEQSAAACVRRAAPRARRRWNAPPKQQVTSRQESRAPCADSPADTLRVPPPLQYLGRNHHEGARRAAQCTLSRGPRKGTQKENGELSLSSFPPRTPAAATAAIAVQRAPFAMRYTLTKLAAAPSGRAHLRVEHPLAEQRIERRLRGGTSCLLQGVRPRRERVR